MAAEVRTFTFLFSDIEGSTRLLQRMGPGYADVLERHHELIREAVGAADGDEMGTEGDGFFAAFATPAAAVGAAVAIQRAMASLDVAVRIGVHTGDAAVTSAGYVGLAVHQAARLCSVGHGGQVLLSAATRALLPDVDVRDLGTWRLKDITGDQHLYQVVAPGLGVDFPPLRTSGSTPHNLQPRLTTFVGRQDEVAEVNRLLDGDRLVTLAGAGGSGKTRLAGEVAIGRLAQHGDGVWWVELAPLASDGDVAAAVAHVVGATAARGGISLDPAARAEPMDELVEHLRSRDCLIVLDNCEHVLDGVADTVEALVGGCPEVVVLATSREALGLEGERAWRIPSLDSDTAAELFVERARGAAPAISIDAADPNVRSICRRLDGMPLAVELAAAKVTVLGVDQIEARLDDRFRLLAGGSRRAVPRQQALRATIDWSFQLLSEQEQLAVCRLSVFSGGAGLEAVEAVISDASLPLGDLVGVLEAVVAKSMLLVDHEGGRSRYRFLETIRQYASEKLLESDDAALARDRHAAWALARAEELAPAVDGLETQAALAATREDYDNLRIALDWYLGESRTQEALRMCIALNRYWFLEGMSLEGLPFTDAALSGTGPVDDAVRSAALCRASQFATHAGDFDRAVDLALDAQVIARRLGDDLLLGEALFFEGYPRPYTPHARELFEAAIELGDRKSHQVRRVVARCYLALNQRVNRHARQSLVPAGEAVALARSAGPLWALAFAVGFSGRTLQQLGDLDEARQMLGEAFELARRSGALMFELQAASGLASVALDLGDTATARLMVEEMRVLTERFALQPWNAIAETTEARLAILEGRPGDAAAQLGVLDIPTGRTEARMLADTLLGDATRVTDRAVARGHYRDVMRSPLRGTMAWLDAADGLAVCAAIDGEPDRVAVALCATDALRERFECPRRPVAVWERAIIVDDIRARLGDDRWAGAVAATYTFDDDELVEVLLRSP